MILRATIIIKSRPLTIKCETYCPYRPVALFTYDNFGYTFHIAIFVIDLITVNKHDQVSILLNGA